MSLPQEQKVEYARHVQRSTMVDELSDAFMFCLDAVNEEELRHPAITIQPIMTYDQDEDGATTTKVQFEVTISGPT